MRVNPYYICSKYELMILSMTGYGKKELELPGKSISIEIRTLNSKQVDISTRLPALFREKDIEIRNLLAQKLERGKIDLVVQVEHTGTETNYAINNEAVKSYYARLEELSGSMANNRTEDYLNIIMKLPEVVRPEMEELTEGEWNLLFQGIVLVIDEVNNFRRVEGEILGKDIRWRIGLIDSMISGIEQYEVRRGERIRDKLFSQLSMLRDVDVDENRLEQELIYYLEKIDITEEKVRLKKHCEYFAEIMEEGRSQGKKLGFIAQEIGREVNTIGSKASDADIQKIIVNMKDELEKIKEQLMNIL